MRPITAACVTLAILLSAAGAVWAGGATDEAVAQAKALVAQRAALIPKLVATIDNEAIFKDHPDEAKAIVAVLGDLQAAEAVPILVEHLGFEPHPSFHLPGFPDFPCAVALAKIGAPAADAVVKQLAADDRASFTVLEVLARIDGRGLAAARLSLAATRQLDPARQKRLEAAAELAKHLFENVPEIKD